MHGPHAIIEEILDWRPFDYLTLTTLLPMPDAPKVLMSYVFEERVRGSTHIEIRLAKAKPRDTAFLDHVVEEFRKNITNEISTLRHMLERSDQVEAGIEEPKLAVSAQRFLASPVDRG